MTLRLNGDGSGYTEIKAPNAAGDNSITLPDSNGGANQLLQNGGTAGALQYTSAGDGLHYDSTGRLLVGTDTAPAGTDAQYCKLAIRGNTLNTNACYLSLGNRKTTANTSATDNLGIITFNDNDSDAGEYARIVGSANGATAVNDYPGKLTFSTTGDGSSDPTPRIEINQTGALKLLAGCPGIDFSGITNPAANSNTSISNNLLHDYEEGTFAPYVSAGIDDGFGGAAAYAIKAGRYVKIGSKVYTDIYLRFATGTKSTGGHGQIKGLPFNVSNLTYGVIGAVNLTRGGGTSSFHDTVNQTTQGYGSANDDLFTLYYDGGLSFVFGGSNNVDIGGKYWIGTFCYQTDS